MVYLRLCRYKFYEKTEKINKGLHSITSLWLFDWRTIEFISIKLWVFRDQVRCYIPSASTVWYNWSILIIYSSNINISFYNIKLIDIIYNFNKKYDKDINNRLTFSREQTLILYIKLFHFALLGLFKIFIFCYFLCSMLSIIDFNF